MCNFECELQEALSKDKPASILKLALRNAYVFSNTKLLEIISKISSIADVEYSEEITSAAIGFRNAGVCLYFNKQFVAEYISTPECLLFVIAHELMHKIKGDIFNLGGTQREKVIWNFAYDLSINSLLCRKYFKKPVEILNKLYGNKPLPLQLLNHPDFNLTFNSINENNQVKLLVKEISEAVWNNNAVSETIFVLVDDLFAMLFGKQVPEKSLLKLLLGDHENCQNSKWSKWFSKLFPKATAPGKGDKLEKLYVQPDQKQSVQFYEIVRSALSPDPNSIALKEQLIPEQGFIPFPGRKEAFQISCGHIPSFYQNVVSKKDFSEWSARVYVDLSGSTANYWHIIYGLLLNIKDLTAGPVYAFSDSVTEITLNNIKSGEVYSSGGTDFNCVADHILKNKFKRVLVISDGWVSCEYSLAAALKKNCIVHILFTVPGHRASGALKYVAGGETQKNKRWWSLPDLFLG